ncbi:dihydrolipoamide acetyltransferase family protein [Roseibium sp.]|uniref:dihydrolipoamide acetyltransferase family protein n=1 Tax=Roseibium sp. TaxID=1936156 RepID=UPI003D146550
MSTFTMPSLGADMAEGKLVEWLKHPGDRLKKGDVIAVVETQKGAIEVEVFHECVLEELLVETGTTVAVGAAIARLKDDGNAAAPESIPQRPARPVETPATQPVQQKGETGKIRITPAARRRARDLDVAVQDVVPGPGGVVGLTEVEAAAAHRGAETSRMKAGIDPVEMRKAIAAVMARSKREIPHFYVSSDLDVSSFMSWLETENRERGIAERLLYAVPLIAVLSRALSETPELNGFYEDGLFRPGETVNAGIAISMRGGGLISPALMDAQLLSIDELRVALADLVQRVRSGRLKGSEMTSATVTISNLGAGTADVLVPVIYPPQVAIVGCGQVRDGVRFVDGQCLPRRILTVTVAADHRVSDGRVASRYLQAVQKLLDHPEALCRTNRS